MGLRNVEEVRCFEMQTKTNNNYSFTWYAIILCFLVMWVHIHNLDIFFTGEREWIVWIQDTERRMLGTTAVAGFFALSGYRLFTGFSRDTAASKLKRRVKSLLFPYLAWNLIYGVYAFVMANQPFLHRFADQKEVSVWQVLQGMLECDLFNPVFWYVKYLMIFTLAAALFGVLFQNRVWAPVALGLLIVLNVSAAASFLPGILPSLLFWGVFFLAGVTLSLYPEIGTWIGQHKKISLPLSVVVYIICFAGYYNSQEMGWSLVYHAAIAWFAWNVAGFFGHITPPQVLTNTFFLYASHWLIARNVNKLVCVIFNTDMIWGMMSWCLLPFVIVLICALAKKLLSGKLLPVWSILNGGR